MPADIKAVDSGGSSLSLLIDLYVAMRSASNGSRSMLFGGKACLTGFCRSI